MSLKQDLHELKIYGRPRISWWLKKHSKNLLKTAASISLLACALYVSMGFYYSKKAVSEKIYALEQMVRENIDNTVLKEEGLIAFVSNRDGNDEIYLMNYNGKNQKRLTFNTTFDGDPAISPDKKTIAYASCANGNLDIFLMDMYGLARQQITKDSSNEKNPEWSPCGSYLLFESDRGKGWGIDKIDLATKNVSEFLDGGTNDINPKISPNGVYLAYNIGSCSIVCNCRTRITKDCESSTNIFNPYWSKDSSSCNFTDDPNVIMVYTPIGDRTVFNKKVNGNWQIFIKDNGNGSETQLTNTDSNNYMPDCR